MKALCIMENPVIMDIDGKQTALKTCGIGTPGRK